MSSGGEGTKSPTLSPSITGLGGSKVSSMPQLHDELISGLSALVSPVATQPKQRVESQPLNLLDTDIPPAESAVGVPKLFPGPSASPSCTISSCNPF